MIKFQTREAADSYNELVVTALRELIGESFKATSYSIVTEINNEFYMDEHPDYFAENAEYNVSLPTQENLEIEV